MDIHFFSLGFCIINLFLSLYLFSKIDQLRVICALINDVAETEARFTEERILFVRTLIEELSIIQRE